MEDPLDHLLEVAAEVPAQEDLLVAHQEVVAVTNLLA